MCFSSLPGLLIIWTASSRFTFVLFSIYDIYLLSSGLPSVANLESSTEIQNDGAGTAALSVVLDVLRIADEYGGIMNNTLDVVSTQVHKTL